MKTELINPEKHELDPFIGKLLTKQFERGAGRIRIHGAVDTTGDACQYAEMLNKRIMRFLEHLLDSYTDQ